MMLNIRTKAFLLLFLVTAMVYQALFAFAANEAKPQLTRILYNNPGLLDDLAVGLWAWPVPLDFNSDGQTDLMVVCDDTPYNGTYRFEARTDKAGSGTAVFSSEPVSHPAMPVFKPGERISGGQINTQISFTETGPRVLRPGWEYPDFAQTGLKTPVRLNLSENIHPKRLRGNMWKYVDFNGDGLLDLAVGIDDWSPYGWDRNWTPEGVWKANPTLGQIYIVLNHGTNEKPEYDKPYVLQTVEKKPALTYGWPSPNFADFDKDGDLDLFCGEFINKFTYFENMGTRTKPIYAPGVFVRWDNGEVAHDLMCMITPVALDWTKDGYLDIVCGNEDGRISLYENTGKFREETVAGITVKCPVFKKPLYFQQEANELKCGSLATPYCVDLDGDGAIDIVSGNSAGNIMFFKNMSKPGVEKPVWARPVYLKANGETIHIIAGPKGSIQGPIEERYGYTTLTVADWDGDGLLDIMTSSVWGKPVVFRNIGEKTKPEFAAAEPVEVEWDGPQPKMPWGWMIPEGKAILTQWRTTPVMFDWNHDGLMDLIMLDTEGYLVFYERFRADDGSLRLKSPKRIFMIEGKGNMRLSNKEAGGSGRRKICITDWDGDGRNDFIVNSRNANLFRQVSDKNGLYYFRDEGPLSDIRLEGHTTSPTVADFNKDGIPDLVIGAEDGRFYYMRNPRTK